MKERIKEYRVTLLTPCFCKVGKGKPEIRGASVRGMIREWCRLLGGKPEAVWGGTGGNSSKVALEVKCDNLATKTYPLLPHKEKGGGIEKAIEHNETFQLKLSRLVGCSDRAWNMAKTDLENWLVIGCLGQRANRAAGSVWCDDLGINDVAGLRDYVAKLKGSFCITSSFHSGLEARATASDTTKNIKLFGSFNPRKPSPVKMKIVQLVEFDYRILLFAKEPGFLREAEYELKNKPDNRRWKNVEFIYLR